MNLNGIDLSAALFLVCSKEVGPQAKAADGTVQPPKAPVPHRDPGEIASGNAPVGKLPVEDGAQPLGHDHEVPGPEVPVHQGYFGIFSGILSEPEQREFHSGVGLGQLVEHLPAEVHCGNDRAAGTGGLWRGQRKVRVGLRRDPMDRGQGRSKLVDQEHPGLRESGISEHAPTDGNPVRPVHQVGTGANPEQIAQEPVHRGCRHPSRDRGPDDLELMSAIETTRQGPDRIAAQHHDPRLAVKGQLNPEVLLAGPTREGLGGADDNLAANRLREGLRQRWHPLWTNAITHEVGPLPGTRGYQDTGGTAPTEPPMDDTLETLRSELSSVDRQLLELVGRRLSLAKQIGGIKRGMDRPTRDFAREKVVIDGARERAEEQGYDPDIADDLMHILIRSSLTAQEQDRVAAHRIGDGRRALVIGGAGKMGAWFARFLDSQGYAVEISDPKVGAYPQLDWESAPLDHEIIVVATPLRQTNAVLRGLANRRPTGVVFDLGSLKSPLHDGLGALVDAGVAVCSVHPMFGPDTVLLSGRHVVFVDLGHAGAVEAARSLFAPTMAITVDMGLDEHDRMIAYVLGLSHALNIAFFTALAASGEQSPKLAALSSTTFDAQLAISAAVSRENPHLYYDIQKLNHHGPAALDALCAATEAVRSAVAAGDQGAFVSLMKTGEAYLCER